MRFDHHQDDTAGIVGILLGLLSLAFLVAFTAATAWLANHFHHWP